MARVCSGSNARSYWLSVEHYSPLYDQINARALIGQSAMVYCASKLMVISRVL